jgi:hypothetical protein
MFDEYRPYDYFGSLRASRVLRFRAGKPAARRQRPGRLGFARAVSEARSVDFDAVVGQHERFNERIGDVFRAADEYFGRLNDQLRGVRCPMCGCLGRRHAVGCAYLD